VRNFAEIVCLALPENVGLCRLACATFAANLDFTLPEVEELKVAVSEAVTNAVVHAYPQEPGKVYVHLAELEDGGLAVEVRDEGVGIADLEEARKPSVSSDPERMGLGFVFMESFSDEFDVESKPGQGTRVRMVKRPAVANEVSGAS
jgi:stage II sporulation protein AB (anti-sigma F factor)